MTVRGSREGRYGFVLFMLCLMLVAQSAGYASANEQHHSQDHCCLLCHVGPLPFLHTSVSAVVLPALSVVWLEATSEVVAVYETAFSTSSSRAPPSLIA